jgi:hypothetical protein
MSMVVYSFLSSTWGVFQPLHKGVHMTLHILPVLKMVAIGAVTLKAGLLATGYAGWVVAAKSGRGTRESLLEMAKRALDLELSTDTDVDMEKHHALQASILILEKHVEEGWVAVETLRHFERVAVFVSWHETKSSARATAGLAQAYWARLTASIRGEDLADKPVEQKLLEHVRTESEKEKDTNR